jgi:hypothetical protein
MAPTAGCRNYRSFNLDAELAAVITPQEKAPATYAASDLESRGLRAVRVRSPGTSDNAHDKRLKNSLLLVFVDQASTLSTPTFPALGP